MIRAYFNSSGQRPVDQNCMLLTTSEVTATCNNTSCSDCGDDGAKGIAIPVTGVRYQHRDGAAKNCTLSLDSSVSLYATNFNELRAAREVFTTSTSSYNLNQLSALASFGHIFQISVI